MKFSLFGKNIFDFESSGSSQPMVYNALESLEKSKFLPDFHTMRDYRSDSDIGWAIVPEMSGMGTSVSASGNTRMVAIKKEEKALKEKFKLTPKKVFELKFLNKENFKINTDKSYVEMQISVFKDKLNLIKASEFDMSRGTNEIASILMRLENRKKYESMKTFFEDFAYTTTDRIEKVIKNHSHLQLGKVAEFIADMPKEATDTMKAYNVKCNELCGKQAIFYIIADKKDFKKTEQRRDPILLAQSPFSHTWQILGAWDEEMMFLEEL